MRPGQFWKANHMSRILLIAALATTAALTPVGFTAPVLAQSNPATQCTGFKIDVTRTTTNSNSAVYGDSGTLTVRPDCYYSGMVGVANYSLVGITNSPVRTAAVASTTAPNGVIYGCVEKNAAGAWVLVPNKKVCGAPAVVLPNCGNSSTIPGQQCYIYMIYQPGAYPGFPQNATTDPQNAYSASTLPATYPNIARCERPAPLLNLTAPGNVKCMRKYSAVKLTPINSNLPVTNPSQGVEVFPPN